MSPLIVGNALGEFLRARRELLDPDDFELPDGGMRRVPGLRREEIAFLAGVSPQYYARLERGRDRNPSAMVIDAIATALRLDHEASAHLRELAQVSVGRPTNDPGTETIRDGLADLMDRWYEQPAVVVGRHRDVLAANPLATLLNPGFTPGRNLLRDLFLDPALHDVYPDWEDTARGAIASVRATAGADLADVRLVALIGELSSKSAEFRAMWARHDVHERTHGTKRYVHPVVGQIELSYQSFAVVGTPGQTLYVFSTEPDSPAEDSLRLLAAIAADAGATVPTGMAQSR